MLANMRLMQSFISLLAILPCVSSSQSTATSGQHNSTEKWPADDRPLRNQTTYKPRFAGYRDTTPVYNPRILPRVANDSDTSLARLNSSPNRIDARLLLQEDGACAPGSPCTNGACCSGESGFCGYGPDFCGPDVCISNCDAQAQCGPHAPEGEERCPLNVCCSVWGFCGTTPEFCEDQCDPDFSDCGPPPTPDGKALAFNRNIGYYASWAASRPCDAVHPDDLDLRGLTHLYFSFAFFHPTTFRVTAMDANAESLLRPFTDLKRKSPRLQTWIAIGGWSFNDPGNVPNTRTAFSDMARTAEGRKAFIDSLIRFMDTYGFDGADLDWEYPSAEDRGGRPDDTENLVTLCREMRQAFGTRYGLSIAIPASYWYLRHFDVGAIQNHVDWINVMTYDIHGVWDADNQWTGPYARPHTNLTQIDEALGLYWRAGVRASKITLGLAYYGRSFTLTDPSCNDPGCRFTEGARPGECTGAAGVLSLAEIERIRSTEDVVEGYDMIAAVKWMTWDSDQWVSFEDEETFHQKIDYASRLGLGGTMIWAVDMAVLGPSAKNSLAQSTNLAAFSRAGITEEDIVQYVAHHDAGESCYVSFCSESCAAGYTAVQTMRGEVGSLGPGSACEGEEYQTLCCVSGTIMHRCSWHGWRGQGLGCYGGGCYPGHVLITQNTNYFDVHNDISRTCNGGIMAYCCQRFRPSHSINDVELLNPEHVELHTDPSSVVKRSGDWGSCIQKGVVMGGAIAIGTSVVGPGGVLAGTVAGGLTALICITSGSEASAKGIVGFAGPVTRLRSSNQRYTPYNPPRPPKNPSKGGPKQAPGQRTHYGRYQIASWPPGTTTCQTTYTCEYGLGFDQVCDNQRYTIDKILSGQTVFWRDEVHPRFNRMQPRWFPQRHLGWRGSFGRPAPGMKNRCEVDEFPMGALLESFGGARQGLRALEGTENQDQGQDFQYWLLATWEPCSSLMNTPPPITWAFDTAALPRNDPRLTAADSEIIRKYGFDSTSNKDPCFATYTPANGGNPSPVSDHGFRIFTNDPLFEDEDWPLQIYREDPQTQDPRPTSVNSASWYRRDLAGDGQWARHIEATTAVSAESPPEPTATFPEPGKQVN